MPLPNSYRGGIESLSPGNFALHRVLRRGLASSLHTLVLHSVCDNETLHLLGQYAVHLSHLDVSSSWLVDDRGLQQLLLQVNCFGGFTNQKFHPSQFISLLIVIPPALIYCVLTILPTLTFFIFLFRILTCAILNLTHWTQWKRFSLPCGQFPMHLVALMLV